MIHSSPITTRKLTRIQLGLHKIVLSRWSLPLILVLQAITSLTALQNTAFQDEALYMLAGRQIVNSWLGRPQFLEPYGLYFSGYPSFYPAIAGLLDMLGGLELVRMFSLLCMLVVTTCVYAITSKFFQQKSGIIAAALFACQGSVLFLGHLATYDALCLCLLAMATVLSLYAGKKGAAWAVLGVGPLLVLAVAAKYAGLLFIPSVLALLIWWNVTQMGWKSMLVRLGLVLVSSAVTIGIASLNFDKQVLVGLSFTTTNRVSFLKTAPIILIEHVATLSGLLFALALLALFLGRWRRLPLGLLLFGSALLAPLYHIYKGELVSLDKHVAFSVFFLVPLAGFAVASLGGLWQSRPVRNAWLTSMGICLLAFSLGLQQAQNLYAGWAASDNLAAVLSTQVRSGSGQYLAEDYDVSRYNLKNKTAPWQWSSLDFFAYTDTQKQQLIGDQAYKAAIQNGYFDLVELSYGYRADLAIKITTDLQASKKYDLVAKVPYHNSYGNGYYWLWRKHSS